MQLIGGQLAQTSVALLSQTYSFDDGRDWSGTYITDGAVNVPNLTCYFHCQGVHPVCEPYPVITQGIAHNYGEQAESLPCGLYNETMEILSLNDNFPYYCRRTPNMQEFAYRFLEWNPEDTQRSYPFLSNRIITASSGRCINYTGLPNPVLVRDDDGHLAAWNFTYQNNSYVGSVIVPTASTLEGGTTYLYRGFHPPEGATIFACGPRCIWMWAQRYDGYNSTSEFFQCPITISPVKNSHDPIFDVPDGVARLAAASIGLQGRFAGKGEDANWAQSQYVPFG